MTDETLDALMKRLKAEVERISKIRDPKRRALGLHRALVAADDLRLAIAPLRQDAVRDIKGQEEAHGRSWTHRDTARLLDVPLASAGRIANSKLKREGRSDSQDGPHVDDRRPSG